MYYYVINNLIYDVSIVNNNNNDIIIPTYVVCFTTCVNLLIKIDNQNKFQK